jgi:hypothetical protein
MGIEAIPHTILCGFTSPITYIVFTYRHIPYMERDAEKKSEEAAKRIRAEQERIAREQLKTILIKEKQEAMRQNWANMRQAAES